MGSFHDLSLPVLRTLDRSERSPYFVDRTSAAHWHSRLEKFAWYFKTEMQTDAPGFRASEVHDQIDQPAPFEAHMFFELAHDLLEEDRPSPVRVVGAACFRHNVWDFNAAEWGLAWVWLHPFSRRRGHLSGAWHALVDRYGDFPSSQALSRDMDAFLIKRNVRVVA